MLKKIMSTTLMTVMLFSVFGFQGLAETDTLLTALNGATGAEAVGTVITDNKTAFETAGVDFMIYDALPADSKTAVLTEIDAIDYQPDSETVAKFATDLETAISKVVVYKFVPFMEDMNNVTSSARINDSQMDVSSILYKVDTNVEHYRSDHLLKVALVVRRTSAAGDSATTTVNIYETSTNWAQYTDTSTTLTTNGILTTTTLVGTYNSTKLGEPNKTEAFDITTFMKSKATESTDFTSLWIDGLPSRRYQVSESNPDPWNMGIFSFYDIKGLLAGFNGATTENIGEYIEKNGSVIGIDSIEHANLHATTKAAVADALVNKNFADLAAVKTAYDNAVAQHLATIKYAISANNNLEFSATGGTRAAHTDNNKWIDQNSTKGFELLFDLSFAPTDYLTSKKIYIRNQSGSTLRNYRSLFLRDMAEFEDLTDYKARAFPYIASELVPTASNIFTAYNATKAKPDSSGNLRIILGSAKNNLYGVSTDNIQISSMNAAEANRPYLEMKYDKNAILDVIIDATSSNDVADILKDYGVALGISAANIENDLGKIALAVFSSNFSDFTGFNAVIADYSNTATTATDALLVLVNATNSSADLTTLVNNNSTAMGLDMSVYNRLFGKETVMQGLFDAKNGGFATIDDIKTAFDSLVAAQLSTPIHSVAIVDYNYRSDGYNVNDNDNWHKSLLTQYRVGDDINTTSDFLVSVTYMHKQAQRSEALFATKSVRLYEISAENWEDTTPTAIADLKALGVHTDVTRPVIEPRITSCVNDKYVSLDVSDYFIKNGKFAKDAGTVFGLRFEFTDEDSTFFSGGDSDMKNAARLVLQYDISGIINAINTADETTIGDVISKNGSIIGINMTAYDNLAYKSAVHDAVLNKGFTTAEAIATAANTAIDSYLYYENVAVTPSDTTYWGNIKTDNSTSSVGAENLYTSKRRDTATFIKYPRGSVPKQYVTFAQASISRRNGGEISPSTRHILFGKDISVNSTTSYSSNSTANNVPIIGDVTEIYKDSSDVSTATIYIRGDISNIYYTNTDGSETKLGAGEMLTTPIFSGGASDRFTMRIGYDKLGIAKALSEMTVSAANVALADVHAVLGIAYAADGNYLKYAFALNGEVMDTLERLSHVIANAGELGEGVQLDSVTVDSDDLTISTITGVVKVKNLTDDDKPLAVMVGLFKANGELINISLPTVPSGEISELSIGSYNFELAGAADAHKIKAFIWDGFDTLKPYDMPKSPVSGG